MNYSSSWVFETVQICSKCSVILGGDYVTFYLVHWTAIVFLSVSIVSCSAVLLSIRYDCKNSLSSLCELSSRFPFFIAITDAIWCISNLVHHIYFLWYRTCPEQWVINIFAAVMTFGVGYQQIMHAGLAVDMYFKICRNNDMTFGIGEWKLHALIWTLIMGIVVISINTEAYGCSGFWIYNNLQSQSGHFLGAFSALLGALLCFAASASYISIRRTVDKQHKEMTGFGCGSLGHGHGFHKTATHCLTTYISMCFLVYCPLSIGYLAFLLETVHYRVIETTTTLVILFAANNLGLANAFVYFYNKRVQSLRNQRESCGRTAYPNVPSCKIMKRLHRRLSIDTISSTSTADDLNRGTSFTKSFQSD